MSYKVAIIFVTGALVIFFPCPAFAYIDPGAGSPVLQILIAGIVTGAFVIKLAYRKIKFYIRNKFFGKKNHDGRQ
jgi:hypothetical protein